MSIVVMNYKRNIFDVKRTALIPVNELLGKNYKKKINIFIGITTP